MISCHQPWSVPPIDLKLSENEVHVWRSSLAVSGCVVQHLKRVLSTEEITRAERFYFEKDRNHYIAARGLLRIILSRYLDTDPCQLRFSYNAYGKPFLEFPSHSTRLHFNLSHSRDLALYAFACSRQVGVDVEYKHSHVEYEEVAKYSFSPNENAMLQALHSDVKGESFFNCWTRKEAYIKARGKGLSIPLDLFDVSLKPGEPAALLYSREDPQEIIRWSFQELIPGTGYTGALAVEGNGWHLWCWQWQG